MDLPALVIAAGAGIFGLAVVAVAFFPDRHDPDGVAAGVGLFLLAASGTLMVLGLGVL